MKAFKPNECDFLILNLLNEYDNSSLMNSLLQDAKERHDTFGDSFAECVQFAQTFFARSFTANNTTSRTMNNTALALCTIAKAIIPCTFMITTPVIKAIP